MGFSCCSVGKESVINAGDTGDVGSTSGSGTSPEGGHGSLILQYSCLQNSIDRGAWRAAVHRITESDTAEATEHTCVWVHICTCSEKNVYACVCIAESLCFTPETDTTCEPTVCKYAPSLSWVQLFATPRTVAHQAPLSTEFSRQESRVGYHALLQGIFPTILQLKNKHISKA